MADLQVPWGVDALGGTVSEPTWRVRPSWYLVATDDRMIPRPARRGMARARGCHRLGDTGQPRDLRVEPRRGRGRRLRRRGYLADSA